jgi:hypothetical protein
VVRNGRKRKVVRNGRKRKVVRKGKRVVRKVVSRYLSWNWGSLHAFIMTMA